MRARVRGSARAICSSMRTASGACASSASVPSMSRNSAQSAASGGGGGRTKRAGLGVIVCGHRTVDLDAIAEAPALAHRRGVEQHAAGPAVDVEFADDVAHQPHALALLVDRHGERDAERRRAFVGVVRIDDQRLRQFARGAGELRQDKHAAFVVVRGDEFLGDEVHAVVQAAKRSRGRPRAGIRTRHRARDARAAG